MAYNPTNPNGQALMTGSTPVVIASNQSALSFTNIPLVVNFGQVLSVTSGSTVNIVSIPSSVAGYQIRGMLCSGIGDGTFAIQVNSSTVISGKIRSTSPNLIIVLPNGIPVTTGSNVVLRVTNESGSTADYESTLLGA